MYKVRKVAPKLVGHLINISLGEEHPSSRQITEIHRAGFGYSHEVPRAVAGVRVEADRGVGGDALLLTQRAELLAVDGRHVGLAEHFLGELVPRGRELLARAAPGREVIHEPRVAALLLRDERVERLGRQLQHRRAQRVLRNGHGTVTRRYGALLGQAMTTTTTMEVMMTTVMIVVMERSR